ncbi:STAS domain-containing protein [Nocardioides sp.]|uniref:STAS domain-containing protein n=1 Tax=Nocardioides sp. TaxID=35761 RepID=UPI0031FE8F34|nr:Anti-anti-sigma factor [Nocardioides sp.]
MQERAFSSEFDPTIGTLRISGVIDEAAGDSLREALRVGSGDFSRDLVVDLNDVDFLPSMAVGVLATARNTAEDAGFRLELVAQDGTLAQRVLQVCAMPYRAS